MPYAQVSDVRSLAPHVPINAQSQPSESDVRTWLGDLERNLNATLNAIGYVTPVTGPDAVAVLRLPLANAAMAMVMRGRPNPESDPEAFQRQYDAFIKALTDSRNPYELPADAVRIDTPIKHAGGFRVSSALRDIGLDPDNEISVTRNMKF